MTRLRLAFMGSPDFSVPALRALHEAGHEIAAVYCQPPRPSGRGQKETPCPVHRAALELGLAVRTPARVRRDTAEHEAFAALDLDVAVVAAYGLILPPAMLEAPRRGCLNIHASLLPRWRGAGPIQAAILAGDTESGITIMRMEEGLDTGPMLLRASVPIGPRTTTPELHDALATLGGPLVLRALEENPNPIPQPEEGVTYAPKLGKEDGRLDWSQDAASLDRRVRALNPWPGTFFRHGEDVIRVLAATPEASSSGAAPGTVLDGEPRVACGSGVLRLTSLQRAGRGAMPADAFLRGYSMSPGSVLG
ncbi:methionyl-tRNA formyltransferase [Roseomonas marmotae]|uniref:Methionyl-tRNA formyltransferase n=1 Tax=Roseomonas marmotae TaxID=2768161 RepID=A0ABS3KD30_9PROT|nr:methionyl-tRNA formyltransferase [Roseomonas marmotae]MBO1075330.1 methionyl-tRNA formyltransferase [Roseomonas marmotae]QTI78307.1 methionyl-tRNA formyltransferase [Roseomonas marmotae]